MANIPIQVVTIAGVISVIFLICSTVLLSSIIAWLSVSFSGPIPHALGFILGVFSLLNALIVVFMIGIARIRKTLAYVFMASSAITLLSSIALFIPWVVNYINFCEDCMEPEMTHGCVENCDDECCFTDTSRPLSLIFVIFSALVLVVSLVGVIISVPFVRYSVDSKSSTKSK